MAKYKLCAQCERSIRLEIKEFGKKHRLSLAKKHIDAIIEVLNRAANQKSESQP